MSDQPKNVRPLLPKWLPTALMVIGGLSTLTFIGLTVCIKTLGWPSPIPWRIFGTGVFCLTMGLCLRAQSKPGP